jgi:hypothetical protein
LIPSVFNPQGPAQLALEARSGVLAGVSQPIPHSREIRPRGKRECSDATFLAVHNHCHRGIRPRAISTPPTKGIARIWCCRKSYQCVSGVRLGTVTSTGAAVYTRGVGDNRAIDRFSIDRKLVCSSQIRRKPCHEGVTAAGGGACLRPTSGGEVGGLGPPPPRTRRQFEDGWRGRRSHRPRFPPGRWTGGFG